MSPQRAWPIAVLTIVALGVLAARGAAQEIYACATIADPAARLACYDRAASAHVQAPSPAPSQAARVAAVPPPTTPSVAPHRSEPVDIRVAVGYGFGISDHAGSIRVLGGALNLHSAIGNSGNVKSLQAWIDNWPLPKWSLGLEYDGIDNQGSAAISLPRGFSILTDPITGETAAGVTARIGVLNLAYRPWADGPWHTALGVGFLAGYGSVNAWGYVHNAFIGTISGSVHGGSPIAGVQGFTELDYDLTEHLYIGLMPRIIWITAHPIGVNQQFVDFTLSGLVGARF